MDRYVWCVNTYARENTYVAFARARRTNELTLMRYAKYDNFLATENGGESPSSSSPFSANVGDKESALLSVYRPPSTLGAVETLCTSVFSSSLSDPFLLRYPTQRFYVRALKRGKGRSTDRRFVRPSLLTLPPFILVSKTKI